MPIALQEDLFLDTLFVELKRICPALERLERYEFEYCLDNVTPPAGWAGVRLEPRENIARNLHNRAWYEAVKISWKKGEKPAADETVLGLTRMLFAGLANGTYPLEWVERHFYFDPRGFYFLPRTEYFTPAVIRHLGGAPYRQFAQKQAAFAWEQAVGYQEFKAANQEVDDLFIELVERLMELHGTPMMIGIAGPTAAGKTEVTARLRERFQAAGRDVSALEMDHFLLDRDFREAHGIDSLGKEALHYGLFLQCLEDLTAGKKIQTPRYDFISATSSHDLEGHIKPGAAGLAVEPADIIFMEGNFPFLLPEVAERVAVKVVYLTDDDVRLKRKWRRDMDFRKKYELHYFRNRYFREQFLMAESAYVPQLELCDLAVDTTGARVWLNPQVAAKLEA